MIKYISKRILILIPIMLAISFIVFFIIGSKPETTVRTILGLQATDQAVAAKMHELELDRPFFVRYFSYIAGVFQGDLGVSLRSKIPVLTELTYRLPITLKLASFGLLLAIVIGVPVGIISAMNKNSFIDHVSKVLALLLSSIPSFWLALMLVLVFSVSLGWLPSIGFDTPKQYILPSIAVSSLTLATVIRITSSTMSEVVRQDYVRTAKAKGASNKDIVFKHILKNSWLPIITSIGINFGVLMGGTIIIEQIFSIPGLGLLILNGVTTRDIPVVMGGVLVIALATCIINLIVDIIYTLIDPRIKAEFTKARN